MTRLAPKEGFLMIATGERHLKEAICAAMQIRKLISDKPISLVTDSIPSVPRGLFHQVIPHKNPRLTYSDKILPLLYLPYRRTIFLDTDITLLSGLDDVFAMLNVFDFVGCHAPVRWAQWRDPKVPEGFTEINSGVIGFRRSIKQHLLVRRWLRMYRIASVSFDQASLLSSLWWSCRFLGLKLYILPPEYNLRTPKPWLVGPGLAVKLIHGRISSRTIPALTKYLNEDTSSFRSSSEFPTNLNQLPLKNNSN